MIDRNFTDTISVQTATPVFGGLPTYATSGTNQGYIRPLSANAVASTVGQEKLYSTHRAVMTKTVVPVWGQFLLLGSTRYKVKLVNAHVIGGTDLGFQTVDCEVVE